MRIWQGFALSKASHVGGMPVSVTSSCFVPAKRVKPASWWEGQRQRKCRDGKEFVDGYNCFKDLMSSSVHATHAPQSTPGFCTCIPTVLRSLGLQVPLCLALQQSCVQECAKLQRALQPPPSPLSLFPVLPSSKPCSVS